jgi:hypothetical protein
VQYFGAQLLALGRPPGEGPLARAGDGSG